MSTIETIISNLLQEIDLIVDRKVEEKLPEVIRALGLREAIRKPKSWWTRLKLQSSWVVIYLRRQTYAGERNTYIISPGKT